MQTSSPSHEQSPTPETPHKEDNENVVQQHSENALDPPNVLSHVQGSQVHSSSTAAVSARSRLQQRSANVLERLRTHSNTQGPQAHKGRREGLEQPQKRDRPRKNQPTTPEVVQEEEREAVVHQRLVNTLDRLDNSSS
jgi:hypothetical protein